MRDLIKPLRDQAPKRHDLLEAFEWAKERRWAEVPDMAPAFDRAAGGQVNEAKGGDGKNPDRSPEASPNKDLGRQ